MPIWVAFITTFGVLIAAITVPIILKRMDWARQDIVAQRVEAARKAVEEAAAHTAEVAAQLVASNKEVAEVAAESRKNTKDKLDAIESKVKTVEGLVDGQLTNWIRDSRDIRVLHLITLHEVAADQKSRGIKPSQESLNVIAKQEAIVKELNTKIEEREKLEASQKAKAV